MSALFSDELLECGLYRPPPSTKEACPGSIERASCSPFCHEPQIYCGDSSTEADGKSSNFDMSPKRSRWAKRELLTLYPGIYPGSLISFPESDQTAPRESNFTEFSHTDFRGKNSTAA